jgi:hypothetical protein
VLNRHLSVDHSGLSRHLHRSLKLRREKSTGTHKPMDK